MPTVLDKKFRVLEIFGPTIQGEGRHAGASCHFVRFGGCDFRCSWCDSPHAVLPDLVAKAEKMTAYEIMVEVQRLPQAPEWVVLSGGNPGLLNLSKLVELLQLGNYKVMVETQGTTYRPWYIQVDEMCFSPKPPSSGNTSDLNFLDQVLWKMGAYKDESGRMPLPEWTYLKIPIFTEEDYQFATTVHKKFPAFQLFLSHGNLDPNLPTVGNNAQGDSGAPIDLDIYLNGLAWLMEKVSRDPNMADVRVLPQLHVLAWGNERGR